MWIFGRQGMVSIVQDREDPNYVWVRARERAALVEFLKIEDGPLDIGYVTHTPPPADYEFRVKGEKAIVADLMVDAVWGIDYDNFKDSIPKDRPRYHYALMSIWLTVRSALGLEEDYGTDDDDGPDDDID